MIIKAFDDKLSLGRAAAHQAADAIRQAIQTKDQARIIAATGASQFELLDALTSLPGIAWERVEVFHLDEYIGLPANHRASFDVLTERKVRRPVFSDPRTWEKKVTVNQDENAIVNFVLSE
jgi:glucosamine-6-phosphate deaminase